MTNVEKLRVLLPHWIEHNHSHEKEFEKWAKVLYKYGEQEAAGLIENAVLNLKEADKSLSKALEKIGGPIKGQNHHHHD